MTLFFLVVMLLLVALAFRINKWFGLLCLGIVAVFVLVALAAMVGPDVPIRGWVTPVV